MTRKINEAGLKLIQDFEGLELKVYKDAVGIPTVGWGHVVLPNDKLKLGDTITRERAEAFLKADVERFERGVERTAGTTPLTDNEFSALVCFIFNCGEGALGATQTGKLLREGKKSQLADQLLKWDKAKGRVLPGLTRRRKAERNLFLKP